MSPAETAEAIEMPFASAIPVGPGKHLLHIADASGEYCIVFIQHNTTF